MTGQQRQGLITARGIGPGGSVSAEQIEQSLDQGRVRYFVDVKADLHWSAIWLLGQSRSLASGRGASMSDTRLEGLIGRHASAGECREL